MHEPHLPSCLYAEVKIKLLEVQRQKEINRNGWNRMASFLGSVQMFLSLLLLSVYAFVLVPVCFPVADNGVLDHLFHLEDECVRVT